MEYRYEASPSEIISEIDALLEQRNIDPYVAALRRAAVQQRLWEDQYHRFWKIRSDLNIGSSDHILIGYAHYQRYIGERLTFFNLSSMGSDEVLRNLAIFLEVKKLREAPRFIPYDSYVVEDVSPLEDVVICRHPQISGFFSPDAWCVDGDRQLTEATKIEVRIPIWESDMIEEHDWTIKRVLFYHVGQFYLFEAEKSWHNVYLADDIGQFINLAERAYHRDVRL